MAADAGFVFYRATLNFSFLVITPLKKPRTECGCQPVALISSLRVAPPGRFSSADFLGFGSSPPRRRCREPERLRGRPFRGASCGRALRAKDAWWAQQTRRVRLVGA